jgi:hypothetical protein
MESAFPRNIYTSAHDWRQVLMFQGKTCSHISGHLQLGEVVAT